MDANGASFVEWKEIFVSQERGSRVVHYILKDSCGMSILAIVGTERSLRHMVYVVSEEFLSYSGTENPVQAGFKWRSRREVVDWLTSMLAKQQQADSPRGETTESLGSSELLSVPHFSLADKMDIRVRNLKQSYSDIVWLGAAWTCGKQLKHYPAFCRNSTTISVQSFVFVMANEGNCYVAYLEDMYEDKKGQKKVKVRWFHHSQEVKGVIRLKNAHPKEVYITPYTQVISVECVDGPAVVLTREHFEKCVGGFPDGLLGKVHLCYRQYRNNRIKPFDLSKLRGYFNQPVISCLESNTFLDSEAIFRGVNGDGIKGFRSGENLVKGTKRKRNFGDRESFLTAHFGAKGHEKKKMCDKKLLSFKDVEWHTQLFKVDDKIELLCQDSGIRGCWFRCTVLEISRKQMKVQYSDVDDQDGYGNLEEWVPALREAAPDKLGMRRLGRPTIRPCPPITDSPGAKFEVGAPVDAWWSDGWWEGVVTAVKNDKDDDNLQVYIPGENMFLNVARKDVRVSRDWVGGKWFDVKAKPDILSAIAGESKRSDDEIDVNQNKEAHLQDNGDRVNDQSDEDDQNGDNDENDAPKESKSGAQDMETALM